MQVYLTTYGIWSDVIAMCDTFVLAKDVDGVNVYVYRDGLEMLRNV